MASGIESLSYAVRPIVIGRYLGELGLMLAALTVVPLLASLVFGEYSISLRFVITIAAVVAIAWPLSRLKVGEPILANEAFSITALAFILAPLIMTFPMQASGLSFIDALFESISAATTTGLSMVPDPENRSHSFLFARAWMQWYGGLGIAVLSVALLMQHGAATRRLLDPEAGDSLATTTRVHARRVFIVYVALTALAIGVLWLIGGRIEYAVDHALTAVSTGGFSSFNDSLASQGTAFAYAVIGFSLLGAVSLPLYFYAFSESWRALLREREWFILLLACLFGGAIVSLSLIGSQGLQTGDALREGFLLSISAQTTAGFAALPPQETSDFTLGVLILQMLTGGSVGSTAGGMKILHLLILLRVLQLILLRAGTGPHAVVDARLFGQPLDDATLVRALLIVLLFIVTVALSWLAFLAHGYAPMHALFEVVSATGTVGLSVGITSTELPTFLKLVLCFDMLAGRLEIIALLVLLWPGTWLGRRYTT